MAECPSCGESVDRHVVACPRCRTPILDPPFHPRRSWVTVVLMWAAVIAGLAFVIGKLRGLEVR